ncbi:AT-hook motif nuclear-localized protein 29-like [Vicia villosa]|uniref:AT-hook motif nuclear-localized protein 29-like n=1 Tax=Vicia villosa TaxID=3911 RepID=UPI00273B9404|nr:AT-hook motif nuclear-localized protein 29-like [Vicia villosa]
MSDQNTEKDQELHLSMTPQVQHQTLDTNTKTKINNHPSFPNIVPRPRGRPVGSKNKVKTSITKTHDNVLCSHKLEISSGYDIVNSIFGYVHHPGRGICIFNGKGMVEKVTLRQSTGKVVTLQGKFQIISISGTIPSPTTLGNVGGLMINLLGTTRQVIGGTVIPPLVALSPVVLMVASFASSEFERVSLVQCFKNRTERKNS